MNLAAPAHLTVRSVHSIAATVPMRIALGTSAATIREAPLLLIDLATEEGITGRAYLFCYRPSGSVAIVSTATITGRCACRASYALRYLRQTSQA